MTVACAGSMLRCVRCLLFALAMLSVSAASFAAVFVSVAFAPPALPAYAQPICPGPSYIWIPGYWGYGPEGYYWVPGTWVLAPYVGALWTPGYWGWANGLYVWHAGYWGTQVGFYGGINYGFGYFGVGYQGGYWRGNAFYYNRAVTNVNVTRINTTYNETVVNKNVSVTRVSYNGGAGGIAARPTAQEEAFGRGTHGGPTPAQLSHERAASANRAMLASVNQGRPSITSTSRPGAFAHTEAMQSGAGTHNRATQGAQVMQGSGQPPQGRAHMQPQQGQPHMPAQGGQPHGQPLEGQGRGGERGEPHGGEGPRR